MLVFLLQGNILKAEDYFKKFNSPKKKILKSKNVKEHLGMIGLYNKKFEDELVNFIESRPE